MGAFTDDDVWNGGFYELALEYEPDDLVEGLKQLWRLEGLDGCYLHRERDPNDQSRRDFESSLLSAGHLQGIATLPEGAKVACGTCYVEESGNSTWLVFYCPMGALDRVYPVGGFPFDRNNHESWRVPFDNWLADVGRRLYQRARFRVGLIGFETSGGIRAADLLTSGIPDKRYFGLLVPEPEGLQWYPRTESGG